MTYQIHIVEKAKKELNKIPFLYQKKIIKSFDLLSKEPFLGKKLKGELKGYYSLKLWPYRIIYEIDQKNHVVIILKIGHRQGIYL